MPIFSKMASFRPRGEKYPETGFFFCHKFMLETIFDGFWAFLRFFNFLTFWTHDMLAPKRSHCAMARIDPKWPKIAQKWPLNGPKRVKIGPKTSKNGSEWVFMAFIFYGQKKSKIDQNGRKLTLKCPFLDPKMPIFSKMASFRPRGEKYPKQAFLPQIYAKTHF